MDAGCADAEGCLGRRIYSAQSARRARRNATPHSEFMPPRDRLPLALSVEELSIAALPELAALARDAQKNRSGSFRGWAYVTRDLAQREGRRVVARPLPENPYHEEIHLPSEVAGNREALKHHASELADNARWCEAC